MPITLTTPWNPGNFDSGKTYPQAKVVGINIKLDIQVIHVIIDFGNTVDGKWQPGAATRKEKVLSISGADFTTMTTATPQSGEDLYAAIKRVVYAYVLQKVPELAGTVG
jgi:hypothetical protein